MAQLWEWALVDAHGKEQKFQTEEAGGIASEATMLAHLKKHYPNGTITKLRRCEAFEKKGDRLGPVERHVFQSGLWDMGMRELRGLPPTARESLLDRIRRERAASLTGKRADQIKPDARPISQRIVPISQRIKPISI